MSDKAPPIADAIGLLWRDGRGELRAWFRSADGQLRDIPLRSLPEHVPAWG